MLPWQRRARLAVAAIGVACAIAVFVTTRHREPVRPREAVPRVDPNAVVESTGTLVRQVKGAKEHFRIEADRQLTYPGGASKLTGVKVTVEQEGRSFVVSGREAEVGENQSHVVLTGDVRLTVSDGLTAATDSASYSDGEGIVRSPGRVTFGRGRLRGEGVGMTYDRNRDVLWVLDQAVVTVAPDEAGAGAIEVTSGAAGLDRRENYVQFDRSVTIVRAGRLTEADSAVAHLTEDNSRVTAIELRGNSRVSAEASEPGALKGMTAAEMNLMYAEDGERLQRAVLAGGAAMQIAGDPGGRDRRLSADLLELGFAPDGTTLLSLAGRNRVVLDIPSGGGAPARTVRAASVVGSGEPERGLTAATFNDNVEYRETGGTPPAQRLVRSRSLATTLGAGFGDIQDARFSGGVRFDDAETQATAAAARYQVSRGIVELSGNMGSASPRVVDEQITVDAAQIALTLDGPKVNASQTVRSVLQPAKPGPAGAKGSAPTKMPGLMQQDQPVYVTADTLRYDGATSQAIYTGHARMWQGDMAIQAGTLSLDGRSGDLTATGDVRSALVLEQVNEKTKARETMATIASARDLHYEDRLRKATYRTDAHVNGPQGDLRAQTIELYFGPDGRELQRAEGYEQVLLQLPARSVTGERLTYFADEGRYLTAGEPVKINEECRETTGRVLTFFRSTDRILVDGNEQIRTQTKSGGECQGPPVE
jgi:LPS export ABC transporter protein LptC